MLFIFSILIKLYPKTQVFSGYETFDTSNISVLLNRWKSCDIFAYLQLNKITDDPSNHEGQFNSDHLNLIELYIFHKFSRLESVAHL